MRSCRGKTGKSPEETSWRHASKRLRLARRMIKKCAVPRREKEKERGEKGSAAKITMARKNREAS